MRMCAAVRTTLSITLAGLQRINHPAESICAACSCYVVVVKEPLLSPHDKHSVSLGMRNVVSHGTTLKIKVNICNILQSILGKHVAHILTQSFSSIVTAQPHPLLVNSRVCRSPRPRIPSHRLRTLLDQ